MNLLHEIESFAYAHNLLPVGGRVLLAVSGGVDSIVLTHLLGQRKQAFGIIHCNFRLRGEESDGDEAFVRELAKSWDAPFWVQHFDTRKYAAENGLSIQMAARELRYRWFEVVREAHGFDCIATGHNLNDSVETALLHLVRGTGLTGLGGIPVRNRHIVRPLLFATRAAILAYAQAQRLTWREDSSNADEHYTRNALRHRVLPQLESLNPAFWENAAETLRRLRASDTNLQHLLKNLWETADETGVMRLQKSRIEALPALPDGLFDLLQPFGFTGDQVLQIVSGWQKTGQEWDTPSGYRLVMDRDVLLLTNRETQEELLPVQADDLMVRTPDGGRLLLTQTAPGAVFPTAPESALVDADILQFPLLLRRWRPGDVFQPMGMGGQHQKLQDFFTNQKLSRLEKEKIWVLENRDQHIVWIVGMRLDNRFKVRSETCKLLKLTWIKH
ncbi:MAG: tRNA lysidine(34) synthetase TilS [Saprospiraceae bacterium]|jgi:tRNA(Ile)-lysidine synthase|nr:tRNA lysidine(34) synthetase TilS [Saprospiraceae bacterium]